MHKLLFSFLLAGLLAPAAFCEKAEPDVDAEYRCAVEPVVVSVHAAADGVALTVDGQAVTLEGLSAVVKYRVSMNPGQPVRIEAEGDLPWVKISEVIDVCNRAGAKNVSFTRLENKK